MNSYTSGCARADGFNWKNKINIFQNKTRSNLNLSQRELRYNKRKQHKLESLPNLKLQQTKVKLDRSPIHNYGVFALEPISAGEMIIEYVGEKIRSIVADLRETSYKKAGIENTYFFKIDSNTVIDATNCGNISRYINHNCDVKLIALFMIF